MWTRLFANVLGSTATSMVTVFSTYLLCLALGAILFGRTRASGPSAVRLYGWIEIAVGLSALASGLLLLWGRGWLISVVPVPENFILGSLVRMAAAFAVFGVPAVLMGGTLPVILSGVRGWTLPQNAIGWLYGFNTLGGAFGALTAGFYLLWQLGIMSTLIAGMTANCVIGVVALVLANRMPEAPEVPEAEEPETADASTSESSVEATLWAFLAFMSGAVVLGSEILYGRIARFILGDRTMAFSYLLFVFLVSLALSSMLAPYLARRFCTERGRSPVSLVGITLLVGAVVQVISVIIAQQTISGEALQFMSSRLAISALLIAPPALVLGLTFPVLLWSARNLNTLPARVVGSLYFINTVGAVIGSAAAGFAFSRWIGTLPGFMVVTGSMVVVGSVLIFMREKSTGFRTLAVLAPLVYVAVCFVHPTQIKMLRPGELPMVYEEDEYGIQQVVRTAEGYIRIRNNRVQLIYDLGHPQTSHAQQMAAHLTMLLADEAKNIVNVGTGYGITAGAYTLYDEPERIDTVEILPFLVRMQRQFGDYNFNYLDDERVMLDATDGRHFLTTSDIKYDVVSVNVLDPYLPGSSALYTVDFWEEAKSRMAPGGVYTQLFWGADLPTLIKGLKTVFPTVLFFSTYGGTSYNVIAFAEPMEPSEIEFRLDRLTERARESIGRFIPRTPEQYLGRVLAKAKGDLGGLEAAAAASTEPLHTDDRPVLEYKWSHGARGISIFDSPLVEQ